MFNDINKQETKDIFKLLKKVSFDAYWVAHI